MNSASLHGAAELRQLDPLRTCPGFEHFHQVVTPPLCADADPRPGIETGSWRRGISSSRLAPISGSARGPWSFLAYITACLPNDDAARGSSAYAGGLPRRAQWRPELELYLAEGWASA